MTFLALHIDWHRIQRIGLAHLCEGLPGERRTRIDRYRKVEDRYRSALAGRLAIHLFQRSFPDCAVPPIRTDTLDRPYFEGWSGFDFNLSHSGDWVVTEHRILLDVLSASERAALEELPLEARAERFTTLWTLKEAYAKAVGMGLRMDFSALAFDLLPDGRTATLQGDSSGRRFRIFRLDRQHICATCHDRECPTATPEVIDAMQFIRDASEIAGTPCSFP